MKVNKSQARHIDVVATHIQGMRFAYNTHTHLINTYTQVIHIDTRATYIKPDTNIEYHHKVKNAKLP